MTEQITIPQRPLVSSTREPMRLTLKVKEGKIPEDIYGYVFINTPNGTVNSALPYPKTHPDGSPNQEYGSPLLGGAGYILKFDLNQPDAIHLQADLLKPPSYYADEATKYGTPHHKLLGFRNMGIARLSFVLGAYDQLGTAVIPVKFKNDKTPRLLATADLGRAYEFDGHTLRVQRPIGSLSDYQAATPPIVPWIFKLIQGTAHPTFDPITQEFFTVNYTKAIKTLLYASGLLPLLQSQPEFLEKLLEEIIDKWEEKHGDTLDSIDDFLTFVEESIAAKKGKFWKVIQKLLDCVKNEAKIEDAVYVLRYTNHQDYNRWRVVNEKGENIKIIQCMHQTSLSKDYLILIDAAFKLSLDVLMNNPFPNNVKIDAFLRKHTTAAQKPYTPVYLIKRSELNTSSEIIQAKSLMLRPEFIHFTADYANDNDLITLYTASNSAACLAEWVRFYDKLLPEQPIEAGTEGILCVGSMDVNRVGKIVINGQNATIQQENLIYHTGNPENPQDMGPHTWLAGFYTFRDIISAEKPVERIKNIYWQFGGLEQRRLTKFIFDLYQNYENRIVPVEMLKKYSEQGVPLQIARLNTETMLLEDYYQFPENYSLGAIQFIPRKRDSTDDSIDLSQDGYLFTTMINGIAQNGVVNYVREVWIFDAANLKQGPVTVLTHPEFNFGFTLHSVWIEGMTNIHQNISLRNEFESFIKNTPKKYKKTVEDVFENNIYANFEREI